MRYKFATITMTSIFMTAALPALAQASAEQQELLQGIALVGTIAERVILGMLILIGLIATIRSLMPRPEEEPKYSWSTLGITLGLGLSAAMTAFIIERWSNLIRADILISLIIATSLIVGTYISKRIYRKNLQEQEDWMRDNYDLQSLQVRKASPGRKSFFGKPEELN